MHYLIVVEPATPENPDFGVIIPDLPGCFSQGSNFEEALENARESAVLWLEACFDAGRDAPQASCFQDLRDLHPEWNRWIWSSVYVDLSKIGNKIERINLTIPTRALRRLDDAARQHGETRSGFVTKMVMSRRW